ncbi:DNA-binding response regulator [Cohnella endophytica]|uniref:DNA-binding response regulator n=1 Tax=Cohnella endophytica TaxID=2419778 RepID=A0A494Y7J1_9BACL|nr:response regulator transcription factor [Cohnella endophytica]RKP56288.1 DNA-binding response regulator [Cohnella endophytica]
MKLLIVDDEIQIRQGIKEGIDWKSYGFDEVFDAENGVVALDIFRSFQPEIIITDIRMPGMDGLELSKRIRELSKTCKIIILSGYSDFEYAKTALRIGVNEYELKPVKIKSLIQMVAQLKAKVEKEAANEQLNRIAREQQMVDSILQGEISNSREIKRIFREYYQVHFDKSLICIVADVDRIKTETQPSSDNEGFYSAFSQQLEQMSQALEGILIEKSSQLIYILVSQHKRSDLNDKIQSYFKKINRSLHEIYQKSISMGVSTIGDLENIPNVIEEANKALEKKFIYGRASLIFYKDIQAVHESQHPYVVKENELKEYIMQSNAESAKQLINDEFDHISQSSLLTVFRVKIICLELIHILLRSLNEQRLEIELWKEEEELNHLEWMEDCFNWVIRIYERVFYDLSKSNTSRHNPNISKAIKFTRKHFQEELSIEVLANYVGFTPNYFSHLFKKETGIAFNEFLNKTRIDEAKRLLKQSNLVVYEISEKIGFQNYKYFIQVFKKLEGYSPTKYRKNL